MVKYFALIAIQLFFITYLSATVQPTIAQAVSYSKNASWAFEENKGQVTGLDADKVKYFYKDKGLTMFILKTGIAYQFEKVHYPEGYNDVLSKHERLRDYKLRDSLSKLVRRETFRMDLEFVGANPNPEMITEGRSQDYIQYYNHNALDVRSYQKIIYKNMYPHIDWVVYKNEESIKYDFIVHPGGNPSDIKLKSKWAESIKVNEDGSLTMNSIMGSITEDKPISFQEGNSIHTSFKLENELISFHISDYDPTKELVIDPSVEWATYYGGNQEDFITKCVHDKSNNIYIIGSTASTTNIANGGFQIFFKEILMEC